jgi:hypothetical protein
MLFRWLTITGHVTTNDGQPASRVEVDARSTEGREAAIAKTDTNGRYELRINRPGQYYLGTSLNHSPTRDNPYPQWFYPGTVDQVSAVVIEFSGKPDVRNFDFALPDKQSERTIEGVVFTTAGTPMPRARVAVYDSSNNVIAFGVADEQGRFSLQVYANVRYRFHAVWPGNKPDEAMSAVPMDIEPGTDPLNFRMSLTEHGNSTMTNWKGPAPY